MLAVMENLDNFKSKIKNSKITKRQKQIYEIIEHSIKLRGFPPSIREIGEKVGLSSSSTVHRHLVNLEKGGLIRRNPLQIRTQDSACDCEISLNIEDIPCRLPILGETAILEKQYFFVKEKKGSPFISVSSLLWKFNKTHHVFLYQVKDRCRPDMNFCKDDIILIDPEAEIINDNLIMASIGSNLIIGKYYNSNGILKIDPCEKNLRPLVVKEINIIGKIIGSIRTNI